MGQRMQQALSAIQGALEENSTEIQQHNERLGRLETIVTSQAHEIARLQDDVMNIRNGSIRAAIDRGVPTRIVAQAHGLTPGRVSQIAPRKQPPQC